MLSIKKQKTFTMKKILVASAVIAVFLLSGCTAGKKYSDSFSAPIPLQVDSLKINQIVQVEDWTKAGDKVLIFSPLTKNVFYVYKLPEFRFLYDFGQKGGGPEDFSEFMRLPEGNLMNDDLYVYDNGDSQGALSVISLSDDSYTQKRLRDTRKGFNYVVSDSVWIGYYPLTIDWKDMSAKGYMNIWNKRGETTQELPLLSHTSQFGISYRDMQNKSGIMIQGDVRNQAGVATNGKKLVIYYPDAFRMEFYKLNPNGTVELEKSLGETYTLDELNKMDMAGRKKGESLTLLRATDDYIYAFKYEYKNDGDEWKPVKSFLEIYDWNGEGIVKYDLGRHFDKYIVDEKNRKLFCYNTEFDFDYVYVYDYKLH